MITKEQRIILEAAKDGATRSQIMRRFSDDICTFSIILAKNYLLQNGMIIQQHNNAERSTYFKYLTTAKGLEALSWATTK